MFIMHFRHDYHAKAYKFLKCKEIFCSFLLKLSLTVLHGCKKQWYLDGFAMSHANLISQVCKQAVSVYYR